MQVEQIPTSQLVPYARNSRTHSDEQVAQIMASIREFGFCNPVLIDGDNGIIAGHGRVMAASRMKLESVPCVRLSHLSESQKRAYVIADNRIALNASWDDEMLSLELQELHTDEFDVGKLGFDVDELAKLLELDETDTTEADAEPQLDKAEELAKTWGTQLGQLWQCGQHRVLCGDCEKEESYATLLDGEKADLVFTDPYGMSYKSNMRTASRKFDELANDDKILTEWIPIAERHSRGWVFVWTTWKVLEQWVPVLRPFGRMTNLVVWHKPGGGIGDLTHTFSTDHELAMVFNRGAELCGKRIGSVWTFSKDASSAYQHPTQKPTELAREAIEKTTRDGAKVLDVFLGSGTTLIAAEQLGRTCYGMEISPAYVAVILQRFQDATGKTPVLVNNVGTD